MLIKPDISKFQFYPGWWTNDHIGDVLKLNHYLCLSRLEKMCIQVNHHTTSVAYLESNLTKRVAAPGICTFPCEKTKHVTFVVASFNTILQDNLHFRNSHDRNRLT